MTELKRKLFYINSQKTIAISIPKDIKDTLHLDNKDVAFWDISSDDNHEGNGKLKIKIWWETTD